VGRSQRLDHFVHCRFQRVGDPNFTGSLGSHSDLLGLRPFPSSMILTFPALSVASFVPRLPSKFRTIACSAVVRLGQWGSGADSNNLENLQAAAGAHTVSRKSWNFLIYLRPCGSRLHGTS
jgi:hypothetical protein